MYATEERASGIANGNITYEKGNDKKGNETSCEVHISNTFDMVADVDMFGAIVVGTVVLSECQSRLIIGIDNSWMCRHGF